jgi:hypothetical protein
METVMGQVPLAIIAIDAFFQPNAVKLLPPVS